ncbi:GPI-anchor biosynthesis protein [Grosmannia clavigera kw1407]|uniref:GPI-anchor biosynthesis protein n=1 Tax=Grosmannia clavigera (strain kw1407 / UAMH 11150) TaxID=655863 RepID=F0XG87_GROCL|nr:GPI-anchor biosynthesis protein [Grosmannia clavigera kw1407]EFX03013.1 GPI-anchor biosynthesis protein [Grosmannia clavigera kw1407]
MPLVDPVTMSSATATPNRRRRGGPSAKSSSHDDSITTTKSATNSSLSASSPSSTPPAYATSLALASRHGSPLLLLAGLALSFGGLVGSGPTQDSSNSTNTTTNTTEDGYGTGIGALAGLLVASTVVQVAAAVIGLPPAGSDAESQKKRRARKDQRKPNVIVTTFLSLLLTVLAVPLVHVVLVLFGAPFLVHAPSTLLCAGHIAVLGLFPVVFTHGTDSPGWLALISGDFFSAAAKGGLSVADAASAAGLWGTCIGAWLGAVPIPLDWDRPWQRWPVTIVVGAYVGHAVGRLLGGALQQQRRS